MKTGIKIGIGVAVLLGGYFVYNRFFNKKTFSIVKKAANEYEDPASCLAAGYYWEIPFGGIPIPSKCMTKEQVERNNTRRKIYRDSVSDISLTFGKK